MSKIIHSPNLQSMSNIRHGFFTSLWGDCGFSKSPGDLEISNPNRQSIAAHFQLPYSNLLSCYQTHSSDVVVVDKAWSTINRPKADAMVTNVQGVALGILTADCVPVLFVDRGKGVIAACHAGWRGAVGGVIENTILAMEKLGANRRYIHAALGPCIWQNSYEVGPEFVQTFLQKNTDNSKYFVPSSRSEHFLFDLPGYVEAKMRHFGVASVEASPGDTAAEPDRFFSYRRSFLRQEQRGGSLISVIVLAG